MKEHIIVEIEKGGKKLAVDAKRAAAMSRRGWKVVENKKADAETPAGGK